MLDRWLLAALATMVLAPHPIAAVPHGSGLATARSARLLDVDPATGLAHYELRAPFELPTVGVEAFGLSCLPVTVRGQVDQGGAFRHTFDLAHAGRLVLALTGPTAADLDLAVYGPSGYLIALSERPGSSTERIEIRVPADGRWRIEVRGRVVPAGWAEFDLEVEAIAGRDLEVLSVPPGPFAPGDRIPVELQLDRKVVRCSAPRAILVWGARGDPAFDELVTVETVETLRPSGGRRP
jgi:hypothetical protein